MYLRKIDRLVLETPPMSVPYSEDELKALDSHIIDKIRLLQFETLAEDARFLIVQPEHRSGSTGQLLGLINGLRLGYLYDRTVLYDNGKSPYDFCFKPISIHSLQNTGLRTQKQLNFLPQRDKAVLFDTNGSFFNDMAWRMSEEVNMPIKYGIRYSDINYTAPLHMPYSYLYLDGLLLNSFLELKEEYQEHIYSRKREIGLDKQQPVIGLHARLGDIKLLPNEVYRKHSDANFLQAIERVVSESGIKTVFVTTDSPEFLQRLPRDSGITFIYDEQEKRYDNHNNGMVRRSPELKKQEAMTAIKNVYFLSGCDYIVGAYSNLSRCGVALSYYRNRKMNLIAIRRRGNTGFDLEYFTTDDDKLPASLAPVYPWMRGGISRSWW